MDEKMLAKPSSNLLQRTGGDHRAAAHNLDEEHSSLPWWSPPILWRRFEDGLAICLRWILGYMRLEIWRKIGLSGD